MSILVDLAAQLALAAVVAGGTLGMLELAGRAARGSSREEGPAS